MKTYDVFGDVEGVFMTACLLMEIESRYFSRAYLTNEDCEQNCDDINNTVYTFLQNCPLDDQQVLCKWT